MTRQHFEPGLWDAVPPKKVEEVTDPVAAETHRMSLAAFARNGAWLEEHLDELLPRIAGKHIAVAGQELFVAESAEEARRWAGAKHPEDPGPLFQRIPAGRRNFIG